MEPTPTVTARRSTSRRSPGSPSSAARWARPRSASRRSSKLDTPKTFDASASSDAEGPIVRYEWDLDGNGVYDVDTGANPKLTTTYTDEKPADPASCA